MTTDRRWRVVHYDKEDGTCPIAEFLDSLTTEERQKVLARIDLLEEMGPNLHRPYADTLGDGMHELRVRVTKLRYRILYFFCDRDDIVLTHGFTKKVHRVPPNEIKRAKRYRKDWLRRRDEDS